MSRKAFIETARDSTNFVNCYNYHSVQADNRQYIMSDEELNTKFQQFIRRYEINNTFAEKLRGLKGYEIVFICDDSASMNTELRDVSGPYGTAPTRWDELKQTVSIVVDLASTLDPDGVDIYFLNRQPMFHVRSSDELEIMFALPPEGTTPVVRVLRQILHDKKAQIQERNLLILLATDGAPTDDYGNPRVEELRQFLLSARRPTERIPVTIIACTDDDEAMSYLNNWDTTIPNLDVVDDYKNEKIEILKCQGKSFPFSYGDYVVKILMGGVDSWFDELDEKKVSTDAFGRTKSRTTD
ncbi:unnamed protein product [Rotaria magnacalcarata]|uniref:VWFA domain-containing protein n=1 Tax=Rotaria magnacalcarata TaxID=392030 RepID=A0A816PV27_9BILA|nr:unnamed protein product [Rotaria magnacalcarata]CAF2113725.1 unnamed protein product [Rotaria magnacalcarata]